LEVSFTRNFTVRALDLTDLTKCIWRRGSSWRRSPSAFVWCGKFP